MTRKYLALFLLTILSLLVVACGSNSTAPAADPYAEPSEAEPAEAAPSQNDEPETIILMSHDSFNATEDVLKTFEEANNVKIQLLPSGDAGAALNQAILAKGNPLADVFWGVDNTFFSRAIEADIFVPYESPELVNIDDSLKLDPKNRLLPVDYGDVCLNYDKAWFAENNLAPPTTLEDLATEAYGELTVVENPATSSPGLAFLMATIAHFGEDGYLDYWGQMVDNEVLVVDGWEEAYYGQFSRYDGNRPLVVSYASSPPAEVIFSEEPLDEAPTASVLGAESCFRQIEFIGILAGTEKQTTAKKLIDFLLAQPFQEDIPMNMFVFPANKKAQLPEAFEKYADLAPNPATLSPDDIAAHREDWITAWTETVLR